MSREWKSAPLDEVAELNPRLAEKLPADAEVAFVPMAALSAETANVAAEETRTYAEVAKGYTSFASGDVLVAKITPCFENGKIAQAILSKPIGFGSTEFHVIRPRTGKLEGRYAHHFLRLERVRTAGERRMTGSGGQRRVPENYLAKLEIPLPPLAEQRRIAAVLDRAEALRAKRRAALAHLDTLTQSLFLDLFGDPKTNPKKWPCVPFAELGENQDSQRVPVKSSDRDGRKGKYPYYGASGIIDWVDDFIYEGERLLIGEDGANLVARSTPVAYIARGQYWVNNHAHVIADNGRADLRFLEFFIEQLDLKPFISGTAQPKLNRSNLDRISVPFPPIPLQREFTRRVTAVEKLKEAQRTALAELDALFASLQHRAFRAEL